MSTSPVDHVVASASTGSGRLEAWRQRGHRGCRPAQEPAALARIVAAYDGRSATYEQNKGSGDIALA